VHIIVVVLVKMTIHINFKHIILVLQNYWSSFVFALYKTYEIVLFNFLPINLCDLHYH